MQSNRVTLLASDTKLQVGAVTQESADSQWQLSTGNFGHKFTLVLGSHFTRMLVCRLAGKANRDALWSASNLALLLSDDYDFFDPLGTSSFRSFILSITGILWWLLKATFGWHSELLLSVSSVLATCLKCPNLSPHRILSSHAPCAHHFGFSSTMPMTVRMDGNIFFEFSLYFFLCLHGWMTWSRSGTPGHRHT